MATSRDFGKMPTKDYKPGFIDIVNPETMKMSIDRELGEVSKAFYQTDERVATKDNSIYKGKWNPVSNAYPDSNYENSWWDVETLNDADYSFDGKIWRSFQKLIYDKGTRTYRQVEDWASAVIKERVERLEVNSGQSSAAIQELHRVMTDADRALAERITNLNAHVDSQDAKTDAKIEDYNKVLTDANSALANKVTTVEAVYKSADKALSDAISKETSDRNTAIIDANAKITAEATARANADMAISTKVDTVEASYKASDTTLNNAINQEIADRKAAIIATDAKITAEATARADADSAMATRVNGVEASYKSADTTLTNNLDKEITDRTNAVSTVTARVASEETARASADTALGSRIDSTKAELNGNISSVQTSLTSSINAVNGKVTNVEAKWGVSVDANGNVGGVQLNGSSTAGTEFKVLANRFSFTDASTKLSPFFIQGGKVHTQDLVVRGTIFAQDLQGNLTTITQYYTPDRVPDTSNQILPPINITRPQPFDRLLFFSTGLWHTSINGDAYLQVGVVRPGASQYNFTFKASPNRPAIVAFNVPIPANWSGTVSINIFCAAGPVGYYSGGQGFIFASRDFTL